VITCNQGPPPPNPLVVERFQSVVSQLFQQVCLGRRERIGYVMVQSHLRSCQLLQ
jgi:hypothetical protein